MNWLASTIFVLGAGMCDTASDWCPEPVGRAAIEQSIVETDRHSIWMNVQHYSGINIHDYGSNSFMLEYKFRLR